MRNFFIALLSTFVEAQNFPPEWIENPSFRSLKDVIPFNNLMEEYYKKCLEDRRCIITYADCRMKPNPAYPTSNPYGKFQMWEFGEQSPLFLWGHMKNLPYLGIRNYGMSINEGPWNYEDCCSSGSHLKAPGEIHAQPSDPVRHTGVLGNCSSGPG